MLTIPKSIATAHLAPQCGLNCPIDSHGCLTHFSNLAYGRLSSWSTLPSLLLQLHPFLQLALHPSSCSDQNTAEWSWTSHFVSHSLSAPSANPVLSLQNMYPEPPLSISLQSRLPGLLLPSSPSTILTLNTTARVMLLWHKSHYVTCLLATFPWPFVFSSE